MTVDTNIPDTFGNPSFVSHETMTTIDVLRAAPEVKELGDKPAVQRVLQGDGANIILFTFTPGQLLKDHKAAHPITVQCVKGKLNFGCEDKIVELTAKTVLHLPAYVVHRVECPEDAEAENILLLTMLTGEKVSD